MPLNFNNSIGGNYKPYLRYMASTSSWNNSAGPVQFKKAVIDLENIRTGWCLLQEGAGPEWVMDPSVDQEAARPDGDNWKRGFKVAVFSRDMFGDEEPVHEWATNATGATMSIQRLYTQWEEAEKQPGQVPVVEFDGAVPVKVGRGNTTVPTLNIIKIIDRPSELMDDTPATTSSTGLQDADDEF